MGDATDIVDIEVDKIDDIIIKLKMLTIIRGIMGMTSWEVLVVEILDIFIDN